MIIYLTKTGRTQVEILLMLSYFSQKIQNMNICSTVRLSALEPAWYSVSISLVMARDYLR